MYYTDQTKFYLPKTVGDSVTIPYPRGVYEPKWAVKIKTIIRLRELRTKPHKKFVWEKTAAGLRVVRLL